MTDSEDDTTPDEPQPSDKPGCLKGCLIITGVIVAITLVLSFWPAKRSVERGDYLELARSACRDSVKSQLKDPSSADFQDMRILNTAAGRWEADGTVYATNSFGATVATSFQCIIDKTGEGSVEARSKLLD